MAEDEDDWFERALRELDEDGETTEETSDADRTPTARPTVDPQRGDAVDAFGSSDERGDSGDADGFDEFSERTEPNESSRSDAPGDSPFDDDFATAFENAPSPTSSGNGNPFEASGGSDDFGFGNFGSSDDIEFGDFGGSGSDEFGFGDFGDGAGFEPASFDDDEFESAIERIKIGIDGLDEMILGGVPKRSLIAAIGSAGTGKTTFGLQFLEEALSNGESAVYITLEESQEAILSTAEEKGWPFRRYVDEERLAVVALDPIEMANSLASIRNDLPRLIDDFEATRLVLDSVSLLEMMYDNPSQRRSEVFDFTRSLKEVGVTTMLTSEASEDSPYASRHGIVEYLTDAVFVLQYVRPSDFRETRLAVEIQKIRDANHSRETKPYEITNEGISVYRQANIF